MSTVPPGSSISLDQIRDFPTTISDQSIDSLSRLFLSSCLLGRILQTLTYYAEQARVPTRPQDLAILLLVSLAQPKHRRRPC